MIKYFSAFAGIGGFDLGIERAIPDSICAGYSEVDKHAIKIYEKHYPDRTNYGDIRKIKTKDLPDFDLFCGGFPCQDVSIAGKRKGLCGARSGLFFEIIRIVRKKQPRYILLENVKGLLSSNKGWDFARILVELGNAGYSIEWAVYNSKNFGVPQNRERVFIVGHLGNNCGSKIFPLGEDGQISYGETIEGGVQQNACCLSRRHYANWNGNYVAECLTGGGNSGGLHSSMTLLMDAVGDSGVNRINSEAIAIGHTRDKSGKASYHPIDIFGTLKQPSGNQANYVICDSGLSRKNQIRTEIVAPLRANTGAAYNNTVVTTTGVNCTSKGIEPRKDGLAATIKPQTGNQCPTAIINQKIRRLTPLECERLQGFPTQWTEGISDTGRYKCLGNAVTVPVIEAIMTAIRDKW